MRYHRIHGYAIAEDRRACVCLCAYGFGACVCARVRGCAWMRESVSMLPRFARKRMRMRMRTRFGWDLFHKVCVCFGDAALVEVRPHMRMRLRMRVCVLRPCPCVLGRAYGDRVFVGAERCLCARYALGS